MSKSQFSLLVFLFFGVSFHACKADDPQVFLPLNQNKGDVTPSNTALSSQNAALQPAKESSLNVLLLKKISEIQEALSQNYGKLEDIQHQVGLLKTELVAVKEHVLPCVISAKNTASTPTGTAKKETAKLTEEKKQNDNSAFGASDSSSIHPSTESLGSSSQTANDPAQKNEGKDLSPEEKYKKIRALVLQNNFGEARTNLTQFIDAHKTHSLIPAAYYWLGETYFAEKNYTEAAKVFLKGYQNNQTAEKAPDMLLKLGLSLANLDKKSEACKTFSKLRAEAKNLPAAHKNILEKEEKRLACGN